MKKTSFLTLALMLACALGAVDGLTLKSDFAKGPDAVDAKGGTVAGKTKMKPAAFADGLVNRAVLLDSDELSYPAAGNVTVKSGAVSFWIKPLNWGTQNELKFLPLFTIDSSAKGSGAKLVLVFYKNANEICPYLNLMVLPAGGKIIQAQMPLKKFFLQNEWNHVTASWSEKGIVVTCGKLRKELAFPEPPPVLKDHPRDRISFMPEQFWKIHTQWQTVIDGIRLFDHPLTAAEVTELSAEFAAAK